MSQTVDRTQRTFVSYIDKSREFYAAHGYERPYQWAFHERVPFQPLKRPLTESRVGVVTTSSLYEADRPASWPKTRAKEPFALELENVPARMYTDDLSWDGRRCCNAARPGRPVVTWATGQRVPRGCCNADALLQAEWFYHLHKTRSRPAYMYT